ncbi:hypothetical protein DXG01_013630 [Tephrocybe rancida]|nr:hypothetical protein DXG01_013630 [Tephrocybe rancida]
MVDEMRVECTYRAEGCMHTCQRQLLPGHLAGECAWREVSCPRDGCGEVLLFKDLEGHARNHEEDEGKEEVEVDDQKTIQDEPLYKTHEDRATSPVNPPVAIASPANDTADVSPRVAALTAQNIVLRHRVDTLENMMSTLRREMSAVKHALGPWAQSPHANPPRYYSSEMAMGMQPGTASTSGAEYQQHPPYGYQQAFPTYNPPSLPSAESLAAYFPAEDEFSVAYRPSHRPSASVDSLEGYTPTHPLVAPLNLGSTLEGSLHGLRESVVGLAVGLDALGRQQDIARTNEANRMAEEVTGLRLALQGVRIQMHGLMTERNMQLTGRDGVENVIMNGGQWMSPPQRRYFGQQPPSATKL